MSGQKTKKNLEFYVVRIRPGSFSHQTLVNIIPDFILVVPCWMWPNTCWKIMYQNKVNFVSKQCQFWIKTMSILIKTMSILYQNNINFVSKQCQFCINKCQFSIKVCRFCMKRMSVLYQTMPILCQNNVNFIILIC